MASATPVGALFVNDAKTPALTRVAYAHRWVARLVGLLRHRGLGDDEGLWIRPCNSVHTIGMRFVIDVVFLDRDERVVRIVPNLRARRFARAKAHSVLELNAGAAARLGISVGDQLRFRTASQSLICGESLA